MNRIKIFLILILLASPAFATSKVDELSSGGVKAWVIKDNSLPIIAVKIAFKKAGYAHDKPSKQGIANFVAGTLNEGAGQYDSQTFQRLLEENAIQLGFDADRDNFYITLKTVTGNLDLALNLLKTALFEPHFNGDDIERVRAQIATNIRKSDEDGNFLAAKKFFETMFAGHPYSNLKDGSIITLNNISAEDLILFVANNFARNNMVVSIVGDVNDISAQQIVAQLTEKLPQTANTNNIADITAYPKSAPQKVAINNPQTKIIFAVPAVKRSSPEFFPAYVLAEILGGDGFQSRLVKDIREKRGMAYYIGTYLDNMDHADLLVGSVGTKSEQTDEVINLIKTNFAQIQKNGVTQVELDNTKSFLTGSFALNLDKNEKLAAYLNVMQLENLGADYLEKRNKYIKAVTLEQVNNLAKTLILADSIVFVSAGSQ